MAGRPPAASDSTTRGRILVVTGPSGAGKTTIARRLLADPGYGRARTATTRAPRGEEQDGRDYDFLSPEAFAAGVARGDFLEHAEVYGRRYGSPRANVEAVVEAGRNCVLVVDVQGARTLQEAGLGAYYVFVTAPDAGELRRRLERRGEDDPATIERRLAEAKHEEAQASRFDLVLVNDEVEAATHRLVAHAGLEWTPRDAAE